jgi:hypothetical protein
MSSLADDFDAFWASYPRKTGKLVALREYAKARRLASSAEILAGVERFRQNLPEEARYIPHPRTWLFQGRWMDEDDQPVVVPVKEYWADACQREHGGTCINRWSHEMRLRESA